MVEVVLIEVRKVDQSGEIGELDAPLTEGRKPFLAQLAQNPVYVHRAEARASASRYCDSGHA